MLHLNTIQEKRIIGYLVQHPSLYIGHGASRAVFTCTTEIADYLGLVDKNNGAYIIKVALGRGGMAQNKVESETYENYDYDVFACIEAIGRYIEIMEAVEVWDFRDEADDGYTSDDFIEAYDELTQEDGDAIEYTIETLNDLFGHTSDNGQIGKTSDGRWVAYDYGFVPGEDVDDQTSEVSEYIYDEKDRTTYLKGLFDLLDDEEDFMSNWERTFLGKDDEECAENYTEEKDTAYWENDNSDTDKDTAYWEREDTFEEEKNFSFSD